jgi:hypothetical protein
MVGQATWLSHAHTLRPNTSRVDFCAAAPSLSASLFNFIAAIFKTQPLKVGWKIEDTS